MDRPGDTFHTDKLTRASASSIASQVGRASGKRFGVFRVRDGVRVFLVETAA